MKSVGIDIGTTTISGVVLDIDSGNIIYKETMNSESFIQTSNAWERIQNVEIIITKAKQLLDRCIEQFSDIKAIGLTGQMHGIVYTNKDGHAISPLYTWQDQSAQLPLENGRSIVDEINQYVKSPVASGYGLATHAYLVVNKGVPEDAKQVCTIMDYFGMVLTNRKKPLMHVSNGASLGFWDIEKNAFDQSSLKKMNIDASILPETTESIVSIGSYRDISVLVALGDNQASFLGAVGNKTQTVLVNMGTGGQVSLLVDHYIKVDAIETRPFMEGSYLLVGASLCGGRAYAILENFFRNYVREATGIDQSQYEVMDRFAKKGENHLLVTTTFNGTRVDPQQLGSIHQISEDNFLPEYLIRGFMHGMIDELYEMYLKMGEKARCLVASGNGIRKNQVLQSIAKMVFDLPMTLTPYEEEAAYGAAISFKYTSRF